MQRERDYTIYTKGLYAMSDRGETIKDLEIVVSLLELPSLKQKNGDVCRGLLPIRLSDLAIWLTLVDIYEWMLKSPLADLKVILNVLVLGYLIRHWEVGRVDNLSVPPLHMSMMCGYRKQRVW